MDINEITKKLQEPFTPDEIEWRVGSTNQAKTQGLALAYITNRAIQDRLDKVVGIDGWKNEFREWKTDGQLCGISIKIKDEWITKWDGADNSNMEAIKGGLSDAMKRAAYQWGIGRYLYKLESKWFPIKSNGNSFVLVDEPKLPEWALPLGYKYSTGKAEDKLTTEDKPKAEGPPPANIGSKGYHCKSCGEETPEKNYKYKDMGLCWKCQQELRARPA